LFARLGLILLLIGGTLYATLYPQAIQIDTNINELNPEKNNDAGLLHALNRLTADVSQRFMIVVQGADKRNTERAATALQTALNSLPHLTVIDSDRILDDYLTVITPYRFNVLSESQRRALETKSAAQLANAAQRKLYQLGEGVRLIPFEADPLGWFSDYLLTMSDGMDTPATNNQADKTVTSSAVSISVKFKEYPAGMAEQFRLYEQINTIEQRVSQEFDVAVLHSGMFFFAVDSAQSAKADIQLIAIGSITGVLVLMLLVFRSLLPLLLSLGSIAAGVGFGILASVWLYGSVHILTIVFGASLIGIVVDYSLHYFYHFLADKKVAEAAQKGRDNILFRAMLLSMITSLVGYGALSLSDLAILQKIALFSCSGLFMAWLSVMLFGPWVVRRPIEARQTVLKSMIHGCQRMFGRSPRGVGAAGGAIAAVCLVYLLAGKVEVNDDPRGFFHVSPALLQQEKAVAALTQVYEPGRYLLIRGQQPQQIFDALDQLYALPGVDREMITSTAQWVPSPQVQARNYALQAKLYADGGALDLFSSALGLPKTTVATAKAAYADAAQKPLYFATMAEHVAAIPPLWSAQDEDIYSFGLIRKNSDLTALAAAAAAIPGVEYVNTLGNATQALKSQRETGIILLLVAYALVGVLLSLWYRRAAAALLLLIPASASLIAVALVAVFGQALTIFHIMALFLVLGLGMDYIIFAREMAAKPDTTHQAILLSAITSLLSFGLLAFSSMPVVQAFGSIILIGNTINFIAAVTLIGGGPKHKE